MRGFAQNLRTRAAESGWSTKVQVASIIKLVETERAVSAAAKLFENEQQIKRAALLLQRVSLCPTDRTNNLLVKQVEEVGLFLAKSLVGLGEALLCHLEICLLRLVFVEFAIVVAPETLVLGLSHTTVSVLSSKHGCSSLALSVGCGRRESGVGSSAR